MVNSLWGEEFSMQKADDATLLKKIKEPKKLKETSNKSISAKNLTLEEKVAQIKENVYKILGNRKDETLVIRDYESLVRYFDKAIDNHLIVIDTETNNSLDPINCKLMGLCLYTPGLKQSYTPVNHVDIVTRIKLENQVTEEQIATQLRRILLNDVKVIYHNAKFDYEVLKCTCGVELPISYDTLIAARLLNENESASLKEQYRLHINSEQEKYDIEHLFEKEEYAIFEPEVFALYAATDAIMTYELYLWQLDKFALEENKRVLKLYNDVELPCIKVVAEMELNGIEVDLEYCKRLAVKYHKILDEMYENIVNELNKFSDKIAQWRLTPEANEKPINIKKTKDGEKRIIGKSKTEQLSDPINLGSPTQLSILLYDILKCPVVNRSKPRGTGKDELIAIYEETGLELCSILLDYKKMSKLVESFLDTLPEQVNKKTGRIHCNYNQIGADTGRFSCSNPNLQQIPSKNKEIRLMFKARDGYVLVGSDFSQQEPRLLANYSKDETMINAYKEGKDQYANIASKVYHNNYEDNLEHYPDGSIYEDGKKRRSSVKGLLLGIMYGMGIKSIAATINGTKEEAQNILDGFFKGYPNVKKWIDDTEREARKTGEVEDWYGRKRRLPDLLLEDYDVKYSKSKQDSNFNPFLFCKDRICDDAIIVKYRNDCKKIKGYKDYDKLKKEAATHGVDIIAHTDVISAALRKCVNARIQGGAATMTKIAMTKLYNDEILRDLDFHMLIQVHDELIGECPKENAEKVAERLTTIMKTSIQDYCVVPFKCDASVCEHWYEEEYCSSVKKEFKNLCQGNAKKGIASMSKEEAFEKLCEVHCESSREFLEKTVL